MAVEGVAALRAKMRALPKVAKDEIRAAIAQSAEEVVAMARRLVPVETGALRNSIGWTFGKPPEGSMVLGEVGEGDLRAVIFAGSNATMVANERGHKWQLARLQEFGTTKMPANPYFFSSYRAVKRRVKGRVTRATRKAARKVAGQA